MQTHEIEAIEPVENMDFESEESLESKILAVKTHWLAQLEARMRIIVEQIRLRQQEIAVLHELRAAINAAVDSKGKVKLTQELTALLEQSQEMGLKVKKTSGELSKDEKDDLLTAISNLCDDKGNANQLDLQDAQYSMTQRFEAFDMCKSLFRTLHEDKINKARKIAGG